MRCMTLFELMNVARANAATMLPQGYRAEYHDEDSYVVSNPGENGEAVQHRVFITAPTSCDCAFYVENYPIYGAKTCCSHILFATEQAELDAWVEANQPPIDVDFAGDSHQTTGLPE